MTPDEVIERHRHLDTKAIIGALDSAGFVILPKDGVIGLCPFSDPKFDIPNDTPCPKCGMLGHINAEDMCLDTVARWRKRPT